MRLSAQFKTQNSKFLTRTADAVRYANIVQMVKTCYKIKIGFRDLLGRFCWVWHCY